MSVVNAEENVIQLCPNCHWEFDNLSREGKFIELLKALSKKSFLSKGVNMNEQEMLEAMRTEAKERNENLKKQASDRLKKNAEYNKSNKRKD